MNGRWTRRTSEAWPRSTVVTFNPSRTSQGLEPLIAHWRRPDSSRVANRIRPNLDQQRAITGTQTALPVAQRRELHGAN